jgi:hypothetical protein
MQLQDELMRDNVQTSYAGTVTSKIYDITKVFS